MPSTTNDHYDILIAGAGFAGSLTALILHNIGLKVCLLEKGKHPRFAIGESSTPLGDIMLRELSTKYNLPWLHAFSRYGSWQQSHPEIVCGIKRGFSFFKHYPGREFTTDTNHKNELLVAASDDNLLSDTNWLRADFDSFLIKKVQEAGIDYFDLTEIVSGKWDSSWEFNMIRFQQSIKIHAFFFIDATGSSTLLHNLLGVESSSKDFLTDSFTLFSHFHQVPYWTNMLKKGGFSIDEYPYDPDLSALHHLLDEGWLWALRF
ncbi:MAG: NAD(P)/FAD-dependent oxidoreductase, partial [Chitinophagaceae bacterium]